MIEQKLQVFIDTIVSYFSQITDKKVKVGSPYLVRSGSEGLSDYTGVIAISGQYHGVCYFTAPRVLLKYLILALGEKDTSEGMLIDAVGEVANTLSGNARKDLGKGFIISVPKVFKGSSTLGEISDAGRTYVIPITFNSYKAILGVSLS